MQVQPETVRTPTPADDEAEHHVVRPTASHDVTIEETDDGLTEITVPISSTTAHRSGGVMTELALESMLEQLEEGTVGLWDDHGLDEMGWPEYRREDMYGWWVGGYIEDETLYATARLRDGDPRSEDLVDQLDQGMPIGFSVGYIPLEDDWVEREDGEVREVIKVDLMECSPVGIPDNKDAYANAGMQIASALADAGVEIDRQGVDAITASVTDTLQQMSNGTETETDEAADDGGDEEQHDANTETRQFSDDDVEEIMGVVGENLQAALDGALENIADELSDADGGEEESAEGDGEDGEDEESEEESRSVTLNSSGQNSDISELRSTVEEIKSTNDELRDENEELRSKVDRLESETRESEGRKGITPAAGSDAETNDEDPDETNTDQPRNILEEAALLGGN